MPQIFKPESPLPPRLAAFKALTLGLLVSQLIATVYVYRSDTALHRALTAAADTGYLTVPSALLLPDLLSIKTALAGGVFFTLTIGATLSLCALAAAWVFTMAGSRGRIISGLWWLLWVAGVVWVNSGGFNLAASIYFSVIPVVAYESAVSILRRGSVRGKLQSGLVHLIPVLLIYGLWYYQLDSTFFAGFRDRILFSNPVGRAVNDFYYRYTLYPAEAFKPLNQKMINSCRIDATAGGDRVEEIKIRLAHNDYLCVAGDHPVDLELEWRRGKLQLGHKGKTIIETDTAGFLAQPYRALLEFSSKLDVNTRFRKAVYVSLFAGLPLTVYIIFQALIAALLSLLFKWRTASAGAAIICLFIGVALLIWFQHREAPNVNADYPGAALKAENTYHRVAALKYIYHNQMEIADFPGYRKMISSPSIAERYWMAKALGVSRNKETYPLLLNLIDDAQVNVACMACEALGSRGDAEAIETLLGTIDTSRHWYIQWYAYKALKALGWNQEPSG